MSYGHPYIGVSGLMTGNEVKAVAAAVPDLGTRIERPLMLGILVSSKTAHGRPNKYPMRYPKLKDIYGITDPVVGKWRTRLLPMVHYAPSLDELSSCALQVLGLKKCLDWYFEETLHSPIDGMQINAPWPDLNLFKDLGVEESFGSFRIVLQVGPLALKEVLCGGRGPSLQALVTKLKDYVGAASDVLIDVSGGKGLPMDVTLAIDQLDAIKDAGLPFGIGVAGGLHARSLDQLAPLIEKHPDVSIDAEGGLRGPITDELDLDWAAAYVAKAYTLLEGKKV